MSDQPFFQLIDQWNARIVRVTDEEEKFFPELGGVLPEVQVAWEMFGYPADDGSNVILICHALTGSSHVYDEMAGEEGTSRPREQFSGWWNGFVGRNGSINPDQYCIICSNILGSCYGTTGPTSINPTTGREYRMDFPVITVRDMVRIQKRLLDYLGIPHVKAIIGGSLGAMQVLEWGVMYPDFMDLLIPIAAGPSHSAWAIAWNKIARQAIVNDPDWENGNYDQQPVKGLALAREIAMLSYKSPDIFRQKFHRSVQSSDADEREIHRTNRYYQVENYLSYQGEKFVSRFDACSYMYLTRAMDLHDLSRGRGSIPEVLGSIQAETLWIAIDSDVLYPMEEIASQVRFIPKGKLAVLSSPHGHDAFLVEIDQMNRLVGPFLEQSR